jgi:hypothetical protein
VPQFVRAGLRTNRWVETEGRAPHDFPADVIGDLRTTGDQVSVYEVTDAIDAQRIAIAVAAGKRQPDQTGYAVFDRSAVERLGIQVERTAGETIDAAVNGTHYNLHIGTAGKLLEFAGVVASGRVVPILKKRVKELLREGFESRQLDHRRNQRLCDAVGAIVASNEIQKEGR